MGRLWVGLALLKSRIQKERYRGASTNDGKRFQNATLTDDSIAPTAVNVSETQLFRMTPMRSFCDFAGKRKVAQSQCLALWKQTTMLRLNHGRQ